MKPKHIFYIIGIIVILGIVALALGRAHSNGTGKGDVPVSSLTQVYADEYVHFSFKYPDGFTAEPSGDDPSARLILVSSGSSTQELQLYVTPFGDDPSTVTADRIRHDIPEIDMRDPQTVALPDALPALSFLSTISGVPGDVREIWFAAYGHLFQWSAPVASEGLLDAVISTLSVPVPASTTE